MKSFKLIPIGAALTLCVAASAPAFAVTVAPAGPITLSGSTTLTNPVTSLGCTATMTGTIGGSGEISITSASFSGNSLCSHVTPASLPWSGQVLSTTSLSLSGVGVNTPLGNCGPSTIGASMTENPADKETVIGFAQQILSGGCKVSGSLTTTPYLTVQ
ncbi:hypothetical protein [Trinickia acidisoli]|uniref:hypothetical protein n=1 Tax=Trinickia acidisoli TaxID=2767482 RepID=UPI001A8D49DE|nr:hypothetical protein [Trinickia acidisoli]